jgi:hypothetical protein
MHADVERFGFDPDKRFLRVIEQQGRVVLAADANEQAAILLDYLRELAVDVIGDFGTPADAKNKKPGPGFAVTAADGELRIAAGRFWVDGYLCVNDAEVAYAGQADYPEAPAPPDGSFVVYLDAWERHVSAAEDPSIRDVALGGPDTCSRSKLVWQVRVLSPPWSGAAPAAGIKADAVVDRWRSEWGPMADPPNRGSLVVEVSRDDGPPDPCQVPADAGYFGNENQLYRVEVHRGSGVMVDGAALPPTFKWSRDNGSVVYPLAGIDGTVAVLRDPPLDCTKQLSPGTLVEVVDDHSSLLARPGVLGRVLEVDDDGDEVVVHLSQGPADTIAPERHPMLRRWDHPDVEGGESGVPRRADDGALELVEGATLAFTLEDGITVRFAPAGDADPVRYRTGDYWTFAARAAIGDVIWPRNEAGEALPVAPHGIDHHMAPLALVMPDRVVDARVGFPRLGPLYT